MSDWNLFRHRKKRTLHIFSEKDSLEWTAICGEAIPDGNVLPDKTRNFFQKGICKKCQGRYKESKEKVEKARVLA